MSTSYRAVNTLPICYKNQSVNAVQGGKHFFSQKNIKEANARCGPKVVFLSVKHGGTYNNHPALND